MPPPNEGNFLIELDGVPVLMASEVNGLRLDHTVTVTRVGNRPGPIKSRGHFDVDDVTVKHAHAVPGAEQAAAAVWAWFRSVTLGIGLVERRTLRVVVMDETGRTPERYYDLINCLPRTFGEDTHTAGGNNPATFTFSVAPDDMILL
jgi:phage tail-like protein